MSSLFTILKVTKSETTEKVYDTRVLTYYRKFWNFLGLWPEINGVECDWRSRWRYIYPRVVLGLACYGGFVVCGIELCKKSNDFLTVAELATSFSISLAAGVKIAALVFQPGKVNDLVANVEKLHGSPLSGDKYAKSTLRRAKLFSKFLSVYLPIPATGLMIFEFVIVSGFVLYRRKLYFHGWYPCDIHFSPCFELAAIFPGVFGVTLILSIGMSDGFLLDLLAQTLAQFKILRNNIKSIRCYSEKKVKEVMRAKQKVFKNNELDNGCATVQMSEGRDKFGTRTRAPQVGRSNRTRLQQKHRGPNKMRLAAQRLIKDPQRVADLIRRREARRVEDRKREVNSEMERRLGECVKHHQALLSLTNDLQEMFNPSVIVLLMTNLTTTSIMVLYISMVGAWDVRAIAMMTLSGLLILELLVVCWLSNEITQQGLEVKDVVYECDWFEATESFKRSMRIVISRSNNPVLFRAAGFVPLSMETFSDVIKKAYSYLTVLRTTVATNK